MISQNEVNTHSPDHNTERNSRNAILIRVHLGSNDHRNKTVNTNFESSLHVALIWNSLDMRMHSKPHSTIGSGA